MAAAFLSLCCGIAVAHEAHETQLQHLQGQLAQIPSAGSPESVPLILRRADLHRRQRAWGAAMRDYKHVADIDPANLDMILGRTQLYLDQHDYVQALDWSTRLLNQHREHALAGLLHARALAGTGKIDAASIVFEQSVGLLKKPRPEHYLEYAQLILTNASTAESRTRAIAIIDNGAETLGHPVSLHSAAYELEKASGSRAAALRRANSVLARNRSLLNWRLLRAELLMEMGFEADAHAEMLCLVHQIEQLPEQRRASRANQELIERSKLMLDSSTHIKQIQCV